MAEINLQALTELVEKGEQLKAALQAPEVQTFLRLAQESAPYPVSVPVIEDRLVGVKEAAKILHVSPNQIGRYVKQGLLEPLYTPPVSNRKFWLQKVMEIPQPMKEGEEDGIQRDEVPAANKRAWV